MDPAERGVFVQVSPDGCLPVDEGGGGEPTVGWLRRQFSLDKKGRKWVSS